MSENWKIVKDFPDYMVSDQGRVKSFKRYKEGKLLKPGKDKDGYLRIILWENGKPNYKRINRLVLEVFNPVVNMDKLQSNHKNGIKEENIFPKNLEWMTCSENNKHAFKIGLKKPMNGKKHPMFGIHKCGKDSPNFGRIHTEKWKKEHSERTKGENHPRTKLKEKDVIEIWNDINEGILTQKQIGEKFGVKAEVISSIKTKRTWKNIKYKGN